MKMSTSNTERYWFLFYNNQILLHKSGQSFDIPYASSAPAAYADALDVNYSDHVPAVAARLNAQFEETDEYVLQEYYYDSDNTEAASPAIVDFFLIQKDTLKVTDENTKEWH